MSVFMISDTHFCHNNIIKYCNRPFENTEEMNEFMINKWNNVVGIDDTVYMLGDFCLGTKEDILSIGTRLNGKKFLIKGNHDRGTNKTYFDAGFEQISSKPIIYSELYILSHHPLERIPQGFYNICGHMHPVVNYTIDDPKAFNVGVEANNYTPIKFEDIQKVLKTKGVYKI